MAVTIKDVARLANVSTATVSRVVNDDPLVTASTRTAVLKVIAETGYRRNSVARNLKTSRTHTIGFLTPEIANDFFMHIAEGVEAELQKSGYSLLICNTSESRDKEIQQIDLMSDQQVEGIILIPSSSDGHHLKTLTSRNIPSVLIDRLVKGYSTDAVLTDNFQGSYSAAEYFFRAGIKRIAYIGGRSGLTTAEERWEGFRKAHVDYGIPLDKGIVRFGDFHAASGYTLIRDILAQPDPPRHIFIANYFMHTGATRYLIESGEAGSTRIQTAGWDSMELSPLLTYSTFSISQPMHAMGSMAAQMVLERVTSDKVIEPRVERLTTTLLEHSPVMY